MFKITNSSTYDEMPEGGDIPSPGNSKQNLTGTWRTKKPIWIEENCIQCGLCWAVCPEDCIILDDEQKARGEFDYEYCKGCGICAEACPFSAIEMVKEEDSED